MAHRILFENEIVNQHHNNSNTNEEIVVKKEDEQSHNDSSQDLTQEIENREFTDTNSDPEHSITKDTDILRNVILLGSRLPKINKIPIEHMGSSQCEGNIGIEKTKAKRRNKTELEMLDIGIKEDDEDLDEQNYVFGAENKIFRKYNLRKIEQIISYKELEDIKPKRRISTDDETDLACPVCQQEFENKVSLLNHLRIHNKTVHAYTCSLCNQKFDKNADLIAHKQTHTKESFLCQTCKLAFSNHCDFLLHNYKHLDQPYFQCPECGLHYRKAIYRVHITTHFHKYLSCYLCSFVTNNERNLQIHIKQHSNKFTCVECGKVFNNKEMYKYHMSVHTGVKKIQCLYCGVGFRTANARAVHARTHTGEKPLTCDICGYKARQWTDMQRHKVGHGEKKYTCAECGKKYLHKNYLVIHMRYHTKQSLYECPECNAQFLTATGLRSHSLIKHTSERPFECLECDKKFISDNQYRKHCRAKYHLRNVYRD